jgi:para-nitrobenzyl esterase
MVTVAGESAGAFSVLVHLVAPRSAGLFRQAIMESGYDGLLTESQAYADSQIIIDNLKCSSNTSAECMVFFFIFIFLVTPV